jgi:O-antigen ligase
LSLSAAGWRPTAAAASRPNLLKLLGWAALLLLLAAGVALPEWWMVLLGAIGIIAAVAAFVQPLVAIPLLMFAVPFGGIARSTTTTGEEAADLSVGPTEVIVALLGVAWLARSVSRRRVSVWLGPPILAVLAMVGLALLSIGYADDRGAALKESLKWLELLLVVLIVVDLVHDWRAAWWIMGPLFVAGAAEAAYGAFQFATGAGPDQFAVQGALRAFGHFEQPNPFAGYLTTIAPLAGMMALARASPTPLRCLAFGAFCTIVVGIGLSQSRGAWLGALVAFSVLVLTWSRTTRRLLIPGLIGAVLAVALAVSGVLPPAVLDRVAQTIEYFGVFDVRNVAVTPENWAVVERMAHWQAGWYMFLDKPWLGVGAGNYGDAYPAYYVGPWPEALGHAHNYYLNMLAELGILGGLLLLVMLYLFFRHLGAALLRSEHLAHTFWRAVLAGCVGGLVVFCVHNMFDSLFVHSVNVQVGALLGLGLVAARQLRQRPVASLAR